MNDVIKENLERRFNALLEHKQKEQFASLQLDYIEYLAKTKEIGKIIEDLIDEGKVDENTLMHLLKVYNIGSIALKVKPGANIDEEAKKYKMPFFININNKESLNVLKTYQKIAHEGLRSRLMSPGSLEDRGNQLFILQKLHNDIMEKLTLPELPNNSIPAFDEDRNILIIDNKEIKIRKFSDQYNLLKALFDNGLSNTWLFDELEEFNDFAYKPNLKINSNQRLYNAAYQVSKKIALETGIKDFFMTTRQSISINPNYLPKTILS